MTRYNRIEISDMDNEVVCYNEMDFIQHVEMVDVVGDIPQLNKIAKYNKYSLLLKSGLIYECVRYLQTVNPLYAVRKLPDINLELLSNTVGTYYTYETFLKEWPKEKDSHEMAPFIVVRFMMMTERFDNAKPSLMDINVIDIFSKIIEEFCMGIINDIITVSREKSLCFSLLFNRFLTGTLPIYSVGQYFVEKEFPTKAQYWKTLRLELYNGLYNLNEMGVNLNEINDTLTNIEQACSSESLPTIIEETYEISKGYLTMFDYESGGLEQVYEGTIGMLNSIVSKMKNETPIYDNTTIEEQQCKGEPGIELATAEIISKTVLHLKEVHGIISEMYRCVSKIESIGRDTEDFAKPFEDDSTIYNHLFSVTTNLAIYLSVLRLTLSLIYCRVKEVESKGAE